MPDMESEDRELPPDPAITRELFLEWRSPRRGHTNPERLTNPVWSWLVRSRLNAYSANQHFQGPSAVYAGPGWCFDRFGQSLTELPDGRKVFIADEHEDFYDADFYIYNDVTVLYPDGGIDIFGYPAEVFPPTDFHSATLCGNHIILIGCLGYPEQRQVGKTPVIRLDLPSLAISSVSTSGEAPSWIHEHQAVLEEEGQSILVRGGKLDRGPGKTQLIENIDDWRLYLSDWRWERVTDRRWPRWSIARRDRRPNHLWHIAQAMWSRQVGWSNELEKQMATLTEELGTRPDLDLFEKLFCPSVAHERMPKAEGEYNVTRTEVNGVLVRYVTGTHEIQMTVEGALPPTLAEAVAKEVGEKLALLENAAVEVEPIH